ncbi:DNA polymerase III subunit delta [Alkalilacustris brevis]|uniref:DNA polymerase III subunit delta n=1 Tax=Alkalilacustris brevis TaxID=2026338 RepID=UPI000E0D0D3A|nr:DNA polymerase III subunit delta [Alkalilacustris brevis]
MKLAPRDAPGYFRRPDPKRTGLLIYGADPMRVAMRRQEVIAALIGPEGEDEMRLTRMSGGELRRDPAMLLDAVKAQGFFPGPRVAFVDEANDGLATAIGAALEEWREGDAQIIVTAGALNARSALRKMFEGHKNAYAAAIYDDPPGRDEIDAMLKEAGLHQIDTEAMSALGALAATLDPGDFRQTIEKISLYKHGDTTPLGSDDVSACAPASVESALDDVLHIAAEGRAGEIGPVIRRLQGQGVLPVTLCIGTLRHFRQLHAACCDPGGPAAGLARLRPPVFGPRRDRMQRQARDWGARKLEQALAMLIETDLTLRSASRAPTMAVMERTLIRVAMLGRKR